jgi:hypothetical protein
MLRLAAALACTFAVQAAAADCAASLAQARAALEDRSFPLAWEETTMADGRPLLFYLDEREGELFISFAKTAEGLWAEGPARLCRVGTRWEARFDTARLQLGTAAGWLLRKSLQNGAAITLQRGGERELRLSAVGWRGSFAPATQQIGLRAP